MVKFSICIPAYKSRFLKTCIHSILQQSVADFELIILNDCSPEPIRSIVEQFTDQRIRYYENKQNAGAINLTANWNKCLHLATGTFIMIMGDDDRLEPDYLEEFSALITAFPELDVYHTRSLIIDDEGQAVMLTPSCPAFEHVYDHIWHRLKQLRSQYISDFVYRTETLRQRGGFYPLPLAWGSDDITAFMAMAGKGIAHSNKPVFNYRSNGLSITSTGNNLEKMKANLAYAEWLHHFLNQHRPRPEEMIVYQHLLTQLPFLMEQRKLYTMALSMRSQTWRNAYMWYKNRRIYSITLKQILIAALKGHNLKTTE